MHTGNTARIINYTNIFQSTEQKRKWKQSQNLKYKQAFLVHHPINPRKWKDRERKTCFEVFKFLLCNHHFGTNLITTILEGKKHPLLCVSMEVYVCVASWNAAFSISVSVSRWNPWEPNHTVQDPRTFGRCNLIQTATAKTETEKKHFPMSPKYFQNMSFLLYLMICAHLVWHSYPHWRINDFLDGGANLKGIGQKCPKNVQLDWIKKTGQRWVGGPWCPLP